ncbi:MAG TPA: hypothetical protein VF761_09630 [Gemmatimonadaceae bacterium]
MPTLSARIAALAADTTDTVVALVEAAWPRSLSSREIDRLASEGYETGSVHEMYFLLSFETPGWEHLLGPLQRAGFVVGDGGPLGPFLTVKAPVRLRAFELSLASARLDRMVARYGGFSTLIGPAATRATESLPLEKRLVPG